MTSSPCSTGTIVPEKHRGNVELSSTDGANPAQTSPAPRTAPTRSALLKAALEHAEAGIPVVPCRPRKKRPCWEKGPLEHGYLSATTDPEQIRAWWSKWPEANIAIPTGLPSGIISLDMDTYKDGAMSEADLYRG